MNKTLAAANSRYQILSEAIAALEGKLSDEPDRRRRHQIDQDLKGRRNELKNLDKEIQNLTKANNN